MKSDQVKSPAFALIGMAVILAFGIGLRIKQAVADRTPVRIAVTIAERRFQAEVADTQAKKELGLGKRDTLAAGHGMYFPFPSSKYWVFWMKDMRFPIDIVWIGDGKVVDVSRDAPVPKGDEQPATFSPVAPADAVFEVNAGEAAGIKPGDAVKLDAGTGGV